MLKCVEVFQNRAFYLQGPELEELEQGLAHCIDQGT